MNHKIRRTSSSTHPEILAVPAAEGLYGHVLSSMRGSTVSNTAENTDEKSFLQASTLKLLRLLMVLSQVKGVSSVLGNQETTQLWSNRWLKR